MQSSIGRSKVEYRSFDEITGDNLNGRAKMVLGDLFRLVLLRSDKIAARYYR